MRSAELPKDDAFVVVVLVFKRWIWVRRVGIEEVWESWGDLRLFLVQRKRPVSSLKRSIEISIELGWNNYTSYLCLMSYLNVMCFCLISKICLGYEVFTFINGFLHICLMKQLHLDLEIRSSKWIQKHPNHSYSLLCKLISSLHPPSPSKKK